VFAAATGRGGAVSHLATVPVADLLRWASQVHDEVGLDDVADGLRAAAEDPDLDVFETLHDALDLLEDELP
jgi:hypothetical protein